MGGSEDRRAKAEPWYLRTGPEEDVVVSTRVRLARNLANFPFPDKFRGDDAQRVQAIVFDAFSRFQDAGDFQTAETAALAEQGRQILCERGILKAPYFEKGRGADGGAEGSDGPAGKTAAPPPVAGSGGAAAGTGIVMSAGGNSSCVVNGSDHVRIASFSAGLSCDSAFEECRRIDGQLQESLQFAASYDFGFLTSSFSDTGSGMKISLRVHIPATAFENRVGELASGLRERGLVMTPAFPAGGSGGKPRGAYYLVSTTSALNGGEVDQLAAVTAAGKHIAEAERKIRRSYADNKSTAVRNLVIRAFAVAKFGVLISLREAVDIISEIQFGLNVGIISGIDNHTLCGLIYRILPGHLAFLMSSGSFEFERDIEGNIPQKIDRLRAIVMQEAFHSITLGNL